MSQERLTCNVVVERLIEGERPAADPALNEHVGSCLSCFRTASDLRGLPNLRRQLQDVQTELPDPGAAFWAAFPAQVNAAWEQRQEAVAPPAPEVKPGWAERLIAWMRLPIPAACAGAVAAVAVVFAVMRLSPVDRPGEAGAEGPANLAAADPRVSPRGPMLLGDEALRDLDVRGLRRLQAELEQTLADGVRARAAGEGEDQISADPAALSEDLDELNEAGLTVLA
ncbi:MAG TPA: hypothetical protein VGF45_18590, partial [Polyangia bacterium]